MSLRLFSTKWAHFPFLLVLLTLASCGSNQSATVSNPSTAPLSSTSVTATNVTPTPHNSPIALSTPHSANTTARVGTQPKDGECPKNQPIKGKIGKHGKIFHLPDSQGYEHVKATTCFSSVAEAETAGFHAPKSTHAQKSP